MKQYEEYKDSGVEWIGRVPEQWGIAPLKRVAKIVLGKMLMSNPPKGEESEYTCEKYLKSRNVGWLELFNNIDELEEMWFNTAEKDQYLLKKGDVVMNEGGDIGKVALWKENGLNTYIQNSINKITPHDDLNSEFLTYYLYAVAGTGYFQSIVSQVSIAHLTKEKLGCTNILLPPLPEQHAIAEYLDAKCGEIDARVAKEQKRIELLGELKQSIITQAVTHGLNPNAPLKDSGVEWIGQVPEHWEVMKLKNICRKGKYAIKTGPFGTQLKGEELQPEGDVPVYSQRNVIDDDFTNVRFFVTKEKARQLQGFYTQPNDVLVTSRGTIGKSALLPNDVPMGILHPCLIALRIDQKVCSLDWIRSFLADTKSFLTDITLSSNATTIEVIYTETLKNVAIPVPPLSEQRAIATYLDEKCAKVDASIAEAERKVALLQELKQSLITEVVTGKRKVC